MQSFVVWRRLLAFIVFSEEDYQYIHLFYIPQKSMHLFYIQKKCTCVHLFSVENRMPSFYFLGTRPLVPISWCPFYSSYEWWGVAGPKCCVSLQTRRLQAHQRQYTRAGGCFGFQVSEKVSCIWRNVCELWISIILPIVH